MARARLKPIIQASKHRPTLKKIFPTALIKLPCCIKFKVSNEKVEKVVNPPNTPTKIAIRTSSETLMRSSRVKDRKPINNEPTTFTSKVPYGKVAPNHWVDCI